jgi:ATP-dependent DNA ligase
MGAGGALTDIDRLLRHRARDWIKIKNFDRGDFVIGGWLDHTDGTAGVLVGQVVDGELVFAGVVDIGVGPKLIATLAMIERQTAPFRSGALPAKARFAEPRLLAEVKYLLGATSLRHATLGNVRVRQ